MKHIIYIYYNNNGYCTASSMMLQYNPGVMSFVSPKEFFRREKILSEAAEDVCTSRTLFGASLQFG